MLADREKSGGFARNPAQFGMGQPTRLFLIPQLRPCSRRRHDLVAILGWPAPSYISNARRCTMSSVSFFENVFPEDFCKFLLRDSLENLRSGREMWRSNLTWDPAVVRASSPILLRTYNDLLKNSILKQLLDSKVIQHKEYLVLNYACTKLSYIPWHSDKLYDNAVTVYLNETWDRDWGGIYLFRDEETATIRATSRNSIQPLKMMPIPCIRRLLCQVMQRFRE